MTPTLERDSKGSFTKDFPAYDLVLYAWVDVFVYWNKLGYKQNLFS